MPRFKILHLIPSLKKGGAERFVLDICRELSSREDIVCKLVVMRDENDYKHLCEYIDIVVCNSRVIPSITGKDYIDISHWQTIVEEFKPNVIHSHLFEAEVMSREWIYPNAAYFSHCHDNMFQLENLKLGTFLKKSLITNYYEKRRLIPKYQKVDNQYIAISKNTAEFFKRVLPDNIDNNVHLLLNAIDYKRFYCDDNRTLDADETLELISVGSLVPKKNQAFFIPVIQELLKNGLNVRLHLLGDGAERDTLATEIKNADLLENIILHGKVDEVEEYLKKSMIYLHAATYEPFGLVLLEAMAAGLPVICLDGKGNRDLIEDGKNGYIMYENNPEVFAKKIISLINQPDLYNSISEYAKKYAAQFDIKEYVDRLLKLYGENSKVSSYKVVANSTNPL
ncbi:glycosyltransferase [Chondrinema litorale]|uniref:glycosyltransferase n=1 Tax=Chondrinema litorale TaxID=2994555 RepID=UPI002542817E|nr:glycosyltransferase [Chondrinema litorale]UZR92540.1 glycosyltransferase [Chondrinema litorale]